MNRRKIRIEDFRVMFDIERQCRLLASRGELTATIAYDYFSNIETEIRVRTPGIQDFAPTAKEFVDSYTRLSRFFQLHGATLSELREHERDAIRPIVRRLSDSPVWRKIAEEIGETEG